MKPDAPKQKAIVEQAEALEDKIQKSLRDLRVAARITARARNDADRIEKNSGSDQLNLEAFVTGSKEAANWISILRVGTCGLFILGAVVPLFLVRRGRRHGRAEQARKCPRCLNKDTLDYKILFIR